jgi:tRNA-Thr(GGU) m(6)t(6)A37 methyltransferase TsaA
MKIEYQPIGFVKSPHKRTSGTPIQPSRARGIRGTVEVRPEYAEALADLEGFSHVILLCHLHRSSGYRLKVIPYLDDQPRGLFATRAPCRPNPIGLSVVRLLEVNGASLNIEGVDLLDGTPVLDIKPYVPEFDERTEIRCGWLDTARKKRLCSDDRFDS